MDRAPLHAATTASTTSSTGRATHPHRTAAGAAAITFVAVLFLGGSQDVIAGTLDISIGHVTTILQIAALVGPPIAYVVTWRLCRALRRRAGPERTERAGGVVRDAGGGYHGVDEPSRATSDGDEPAVDGRASDRLRRAAAAAHRAGRRHRPGVERLPRSPRSSSASLVVGADRLVVVRFRRRGRPPAPPGPREHPARDRLHGRPAADRRRPVRRHVRVASSAVDEVDDDADLVVEVIGFQWQWRFDYPEPASTVIGTDDEVPELVLPAGADGALRPDVGRRHPLVLDPRLPLQARHVPRRDARRSRSTSADAPATFPNTGVCAEFCGLDHTTMRFSTCAS